MQNKVVEINLELGMPTVDVALQRMKDALTTSLRQGFRAVILIHGYGSTGIGGSIKKAVLTTLAEKSLQGVVRSYVGGENWHRQGKNYQKMCKSLEAYDRRIAGNEGVTVVLLR